METIYKPFSNDPHAIIELIACSNTISNVHIADQIPVLAARVSHAGSGKTGEDPEGDIKLMKYLAKHQHMTPFEHQSVTFKVVLPIFIGREWMRHRTQSFNEVSMRYSDDPVGKMWYPELWREQADRNKQSSAGEIEKQEEATVVLKRAYDFALQSYDALIALDVCREQARTVIPVGNYTEFYATGNLRNWAGFFKLRIAEDAQWEIRQYAQGVSDLIEGLYPDSWNALINR